MNHQYAAPAERPRLSTPEADVVAELPLPDVFKRFTSDLGALASAEFALAQLELSQQAPKVGKSVGLFVAAALLGFGAFFALTATLVAALALVVPLWAAALIVTVLYVALAAAAALAGKKGLTGVTDPIPHLLRNVKIDTEALKAGLGRGR